METGDLDLTTNTYDDQDLGSRTTNYDRDRDDEINGLLAEAFDDISSVSDILDDNDNDDIEEDTGEESFGVTDDSEEDEEDDNEEEEEEEDDSISKEFQDDTREWKNDIKEVGDGDDQNELKEIEEYIKKIEDGRLSDPKPVEDNETKNQNHGDLNKLKNSQIENVKNFQPVNPSSTKNFSSGEPETARYEDKRSPNHHQYNHHQKFTSTPIKDLFVSVPRTRTNYLSLNAATIPEENEDQANGCGFSVNGDDLTMSTDMFSEDSVEDCESEIRTKGGKLKEITYPPYKVDIDNNDVSQLSYKHVQLILEDNQKLNEEVQSLKAKFNVLNGDHVGLAYQYQQLETKLQAKNNGLIELEGKVAALQVQLKSESEAKKDFQAKLAVAESTIESLNRQLAIIAKSDSTVRLRENYEQMLAKLRNQYDTDIIVLKGENEGLKYELESKQQEIEKLKAQLDEKDKQITSQEIDKLSNLDSLKQRYEEILRETSNKVEYESNLRKKNEEIESLQREISFLKTSQLSANQSSTQSIPDMCKCGKKSPCLNESEHVKELKIEFEKCLKNLQTRRQQIANLQSQLITTKKDNVELKGKLKDAEEKNKELNEFLKTAHEMWKKEVESRFAIQYEEDLRKALRLMEDEKREEFERQFKKRLEDRVNQLISSLKSLSDDDDDDDANNSNDLLGECSKEFDTIFSPLRKLWRAINLQLEIQIKELDRKRQSIIEAEEKLKQALVASKSLESQSIRNSSLREMKQELDKVSEEATLTKAKLDKYKKHYHKVENRHKKAIEELKNQYAEKIAEREREYRRREEQIIRELSEEPLALARKLSGY